MRVTQGRNVIVRHFTLVCRCGPEIELWQVVRRARPSISLIWGGTTAIWVATAQ